MSEKVILHQTCQKPLSEEEKKLVVDEYLREMRSKGGKKRWMGDKPRSPKSMKIFSEGLSRGAAATREKKIRSLVQDGVSLYIQGIRLIENHPLYGEVLEARYAYRGKNERTAIFNTHMGFRAAWDDAKSWIDQRKQETKEYFALMATS